MRSDGRDTIGGIDCDTRFKLGENFQIVPGFDLPSGADWFVRHRQTNVWSVFYSKIDWLRDCIARKRLLIAFNLGEFKKCWWIFNDVSVDWGEFTANRSRIVAFELLKDDFFLVKKFVHRSGRKKRRWDGEENTWIQCSESYDVRWWNFDKFFDWSRKWAFESKKWFRRRRFLKVKQLINIQNLKTLKISSINQKKNIKNKN